MANRSKRRAPKTFHKVKAGSDGSTHVVGFGNLRVLIICDDEMWFAQSQDINYAAQGASLAEVKRNFERGLTATVHEHLRAYGHIRNLLSRPPSSGVWQDLIRMSPPAFRYSQVTTHRLPEQIQDVIRFESIEFIQPEIAA